MAKAKASGTRHRVPRIDPDERPELTSERSVEEGVEETFPASDAVAATTTQGSRAVPPKDLMHKPLSAPPDDAVAVTARFRDQEAAKLAVESVVRDGPLDRRCTEIRPGGDAVTVVVHATPAEAGRLRTMLQRAGGMPAS